MRLCTGVWVPASVIISWTVVAVVGIGIESVTLPDVDISALGQIGLVGDFRGVSLYSYSGQQNSSIASTDSLLVDLPSNIVFDFDGSDGTINSMCAMGDSIYIGGNFTRIGDSQIHSVARINASTGDVSDLENGVLGNVNVAYCDLDHSLVYFGGSFTNNVAIWNVSSESWQAVPFGGLYGGPVNAIVERNGNIIFGGKFLGIGNSSSAASISASQGSQMQLVNMRTANISAQGSMSNHSYSNPRSAVCSNNISAADSTWLLEDGVPGVWTASFAYDIQPSRLRIRNADAGGRGTKTFRFVAHPINGIMNLTYTDPDTGATTHCDAFCPLQNITEAEFQDFEFVNVIGMDSFSLYLLDYYGSGAGLSEVQVYQEQIISYAIDAFNEPASCGVNNSEISRSNFTGDWKTTTVSGISYLSAANISGTQLRSTVVTFYPDISIAGNYTVLMYTPGCGADFSCAARGQVNITVSPRSNGPTTGTVLYQTNDFDKYDVIYEGYVDAISEMFRPVVTLSPVDSQTGNITVAAQQVQFVLTSTSGGLNGIFEYDSANFTTSLDSRDVAIQETAVNLAGMALDTEAEITALIVADSNLYVAGNFTGHGSIHNFFILSNESEISWAQGGLNGAIEAMVLSEDELSIIVGGDFSASANESLLIPGLSYVAQYSIQSATWKGLDNGLNSAVDNIVRVFLNLSGDTYSTLMFTGNFSEILADGVESAIDSPGYALWIESDSAWADRTTLTLPFIIGSLSASVMTHNGTYILAGNLSSQSLVTSSGVFVASGLDMKPMPFDFAQTDGAFAKQSQLSTSLLYSGAFCRNGSTQYSAVGGEFTVETQSASYRNFVVFNETDVTGGFLSSTFSESTAVLAVYNYDNASLIVGGDFAGSIGESKVNGIAIWDIKTQTFASRQPPELGGDSVQVNAITSRPDTTNIVVAGSYSTAGNITCQSLCVYDLALGSWTSVTGGISGDIYSVRFIDSDKLIVTGNMTTGDSITCYMAQYDFSSSSWSLLGSQSSELPGPVSVFLSASDSVSDALIAGVYAGNGSTYLMAYSSGTWVSFGNDLLEGTTIYDLEILELTSPAHRNSSIIPEGSILLVLGDLKFMQYGNVSAAFFDGDRWTPFMYSVKGDNSPGVIRSLFAEVANSVPSIYAATDEGHLKAGYVVLISLAISLAIMFMIIGTGLLVAYWRRRSQGYESFPSQLSDEQVAQQTLLPAQLFEHMSSVPAKY
ncbi:cortical protein marker for cell polarity-domain-containing protein [Lipomyces kononenkoae]|uniref:Cortical protein marker for cell polarity-domain-containing protein n=1 Tax=Lipomyces kononenkoae TaxID=34357 RepID=A0ACC3T440_LIPKO